MAREREDYEFNDPWYDAFWQNQQPEFGTDDDNNAHYLNSEEIEEFSDIKEVSEYYHKLDLAAQKQQNTSFVTLQNVLQKSQQKVATLYKTINDLPGKTLQDKFSLFLALVCIQQFSKSEHQQLVAALAEDNSKKIAEILEQFYIQNTWQTPFEGETPLEKFNFAASYLSHTKKSSTIPISQVLSTLNHHYPASTTQNQIYKDLLDFLRNNAESFSLFDLDFNLKRLLHHLLDLFGLQKEHTVQDGCAGIGLLANEMLYPRDQQPTLQLESQNPVLAQIGKQLLKIKQGDEPTNQKISYKISAPLEGEFGFTKESADFYISCPQMPYKLNDKELKAAFHYSQVHYNGAIARYASDALWVQYALHCLKPNGLAMIVVQDGFLRRSGYDAAVRKHLIENKMVRAVISLNPCHARQSQYSQVSLLILNKEPVEDDVYFLNLRDLPASLGMESWFYETNINWTELPFMNDVDKEGLLYINGLGAVDFDKSTQKIAANDYNLNFDFYQSQQSSSDYPKLSDSQKAFSDAKSNMLSSLKLFEDSLDN